MEIPKVTDGELCVLDVLWKTGTVNATEIVKQLKASKDWNRNTTYTFINRLVEKKIIKREEPNFLCSALYTRDEVSVSETKSFVQKMYNGSFRNLFSAFLNNDEVKEEDLNEIEKLISKRKGGR